MAKEKTPLAPIIKAQNDARLDFWVWAWRHKVAVIVCVVLIVLGIQFREALWAGICCAWDAGRSASKAGAAQLNDSDDSDDSNGTTGNATVKTDTANVRSDAGYSAKVVVTLHKGDTVTMTGKSKSVGGKTWKQVKLKDGKSGWMLDSLLE